eukprot:scaffold1629_cov369-Prasinococcus_capsulatus_cf.AAC.11
MDKQRERPMRAARVVVGCVCGAVRGAGRGAALLQQYGPRRAKAGTTGREGGGRSHQHAGQ